MVRKIQHGHSAPPLPIRKRHLRFKNRTALTLVVADDCHLADFGPVRGYLALDGSSDPIGERIRACGISSQAYLHIGVSGRSFGRLGPKVTNGVRSSQRRWNQVVNFVVAGLVLGDSVLGVRLSFKPCWHCSHLLRVAGNGFLQFAMASHYSNG